ncbi:Serine/threonine-protein kinase smg1, partial [Bonamia ostreae]
ALKKDKRLITNGKLLKLVKKIWTEFRGATIESKSLLLLLNQISSKNIEQILHDFPKPKLKNNILMPQKMFCRDNDSPPLTKNDVKTILEIMENPKKEYFKNGGKISKMSKILLNDFAENNFGEQFCYLLQMLSKYFVTKKLSSYIGNPQKTLNFLRKICQQTEENKLKNFYSNYFLNNFMQIVHTKIAKFSTNPNFFQSNANKCHKFFSRIFFVLFETSYRNQNYSEASIFGENSLQVLLEQKNKKSANNLLFKLCECYYFLETPDCIGGILDWYQSNFNEDFSILSYWKLALISESKRQFEEAIENFTKILNHFKDKTDQTNIFYKNKVLQHIEHCYNPLLLDNPNNSYGYNNNNEKNDSNKVTQSDNEKEFNKITSNKQKMVENLKKFGELNFYVKFDKNIENFEIGDIKKEILIKNKLLLDNLRNVENFDVSDNELVNEIKLLNFILKNKQKVVKMASENKNFDIKKLKRFNLVNYRKFMSKNKNFKCSKIAENLVNFGNNKINFGNDEINFSDKNSIDNIFDKFLLSKTVSNLEKEIIEKDFCESLLQLQKIDDYKNCFEIATDIPKIKENQKIENFEEIIFDNLAKFQDKNFNQKTTVLMADFIFEFAEKIFDDFRDFLLPIGYFEEDNMRKKIESFFIGEDIDQILSKLKKYRKLISLGLRFDLSTLNQNSSDFRNTKNIFRILETIQNNSNIVDEGIINTINNKISGKILKIAFSQILAILKTEDNIAKIFKNLVKKFCSENFDFSVFPLLCLQEKYFCSKNADSTKDFIFLLKKTNLKLTENTQKAITEFKRISFLWGETCAEKIENIKSAFPEALNHFAENFETFKDIPKTDCALVMSKFGAFKKIATIIQNLRKNIRNPTTPYENRFYRENGANFEKVYKLFLQIGKIIKPDKIEFREHLLEDRKAEAVRKIGFVRKEIFSILDKICSSYKNEHKWQLQDISPLLTKLDFVVGGWSEMSESVKVAKIDSKISLMRTNRPKKIDFIDFNGQKLRFLLKSKENLVVDETFVQ